MENTQEKIWKDLMEEHPILDMVSFNELDLQEKLKYNAFMVTQYQELYNVERMKYEKLEENMEVLVGSLYDHYKFESDKELSKIEIEKYYIPREPKVKQFKNIMRRQNIRVEFFETCVKGLKQMGWNMKVFSENERRGL